MLLATRRERRDSVIMTTTSDSAESPETVEEIKPERCRVCLKHGDIPIFGRIDISMDVNKFGGIEVLEDDGQPQHICDACHTLLEAAIMFRKTAQKSHNILSDTNFRNNPVLENEDPDYKPVLDNLLGTQFYMKKEYIECDEMYADGGSDKKDTLSEDDHDDKNIEMQLLKLKVENSEADPENEMIMIIVSDKNKMIESHQAEKNVCNQCNVTFISSEELKNHNSENHSKLLSHQKECGVCYKTVNKNDYRTHLKEHREKYKLHAGRRYRKVECHICSKKVSKQYFSYHVKMHGSDIDKAKRTKECPICKKQFSINYLSSHIQRVHPTGECLKVDKLEENDESLRQCPVCDKKIKESIFNDHVAGHGGSLKRYVCDQCGKVFKYPTPFKTHCLIHRGELKYQCQFCPYRGLHKALLKIHVRTHTGDYNYRCSQCPARFITKSNLSKHLVRHGGIYQFFCDICKKGFYFKHELEKHHLSVHSEKKDIICEICGKGYGHRDAMRSHQLKVHRRQKLTDCGRMPSYLKSVQNKDVKDELGIV